MGTQNQRDTHQGILCRYPPDTPPPLQTSPSKESFLVFSSDSIWQFSKIFFNKPSVGKYKNSICHEDSCWIPKPQLLGVHPALLESLNEEASRSLDQARLTNKETKIQAEELNCQKSLDKARAKHRFLKVQETESSGEEQTPCLYPFTRTLTNQRVSFQKPWNVHLKGIKDPFAQFSHNTNQKTHPEKSDFVYEVTQ